MCSIAGIVNFDQQVDVELLKRMNLVQKHRGPDDQGYFVHDNVGFAHNRLSIIDLSSHGHQPMYNEDETICIVYNGEVYNYLELIPELKSKGHKFRSRTDTEVIIHAYEEYGIECLQKFNGMFALAIWDGRTRQLFCARDRFGIKPFYYFHDKDCFIFASEIKGLLEDQAIPRTVNDTIMHDFLEFDILEHTNETFFHGIMKLPPAHYLTLRKDKISIAKYWDIDFQGEPVNESADLYAERFYELFEDSIRLRLRSDVPIGTCLSGGLDSSSIVCIANNLMFSEGNATKHNVEERQKTFSSCFEDMRFDERKFIHLVLERTRAESNFVFPDPQKLLDDAHEVIWHQDEPFHGTTVFAQWNVMRLAKERGVAVLLDGQGADELLAGYPPYYRALFEELTRRVAFSQLYKERLMYAMSHGKSLPNSLVFMLAGPIPQIWRGIKTRVTQSPSGVSEALAFGDGTCSVDLVDEPKLFKSILKNRLYYDCVKGRRLSPLLHYEDRNSMAFSLESRVPFLDHRLVEYVFSLPDICRIHNGLTKMVLRNAMKGILPEKVRMRTDKMGFVTPQDIWLRTAMKGWVEDIFRSKSFRERGCFRPEAVLSHWHLYCDGKADIGSAIWRWLCAELWLRIFMD